VHDAYHSRKIQTWRPQLISRLKLLQCSMHAPYLWPVRWHRRHVTAVGQLQGWARYVRPFPH